MRKIFLPLFLLFIFSQSAWAISWSLVSNVCAGSSDSKKVVSGSVNMNGATLEVMYVSCSASVTCTPSSITDSTGGNTWLSGPGNFDGGRGITTYYVISPNVSSSQTFTADFGSNATFPSICVMGFAGGLGIVKDSSSGNNSTSNSTINDGGITPGQTGELLISGADANSASITVNSVNLSYTIPASGTQSPSANNWALGAGYLVSASTSYQQATWTLSSSAQTSAAVFGFIIGVGPSNTTSNRTIKGAIIRGAKFL